MKQTVEKSSMVELVQEVIARCTDERRQLGAESRFDAPTVTANTEAMRDLSIAITHLEDARTRINAAGYRVAGRFSISDAERS